MNIAIVDDDRTELDYITSCLTRFAEETNEKFDITSFANGVVFLEKFSSQYDLILMDIDMPELSGIDTAKRLRAIDSDVVLMFVTNMPQYALAGYEVDAIDYLIKPLVYADFALKLKKAMRFVSQNINDKTIVLHTAEGIVTVPISEILYVESELHYCIYHTIDSTYRVRESMTATEEKLSNFYFARCNSSYLVGLKHVKAIVKDDVVVGADKLKISRGKKASFMEQFTRLVGGF